MKIKDNVKELLEKIPQNVILVAAAKTRTPEEILEAIDAGIQIIGENYVQEAEKAFALIGRRVKWHFIGHLQKNKVKKAVKMFDLIETLDSFELAKEIDKRCANLNKIMPVLCEINIAKEKTKSGVYPEEVETLLKSISPLKYVKVKGLMTMGPRFGDPEEARPYFKKTKEIFERIKKMNIPNIEMKYLSMGMSNTYQVAIEEGANIIRIGTKIFGERIYRGGNK
ncbi:YggS family pyridoxal phosphate-dependent enzyme [Candidatus Aerophobetes bacterium]|nr:YggS family pyridoxal phosphate-dependent enzyme [Candidatus Aerophobetes bacterium]